MWDRIRNARLFRVLAVYLGAAWVVLQVTEVIQDGFGLPDWVMPFALVLLLVGLVVVMGTALVQAGLARLAASGDVPDSWEIDLKDLGRSISQARLPHLTWGRAILGGVMAFSLLFGAAGAYVLVTGEAPSLPLVAEAEASPLPGFAVLPFRVTGAEGDLGLWREGMVDLLSTNLEGVAGVRKTDPTAIISRWRRSIGEGQDAPSSEAAYDVARDLGAWYALTGTLVGSGDQVRASVEVYDTRTDQVLGTAHVDGSPDDVLGIVDRLSLEILREGLVPIEGDLPYLRGEQLYRRSRWPEATDAFNEAIAADSGFAMAWYRRGLAYSWPGERDDLVDESVAKALELSDRLQERERLLVQGYAKFSSGDPEALDALEELTHKYPDDVEGWAILGDAYVHMGGGALLSADRFRSALRRAIDLDPYFGPAYVHLIEDSFSRWDSVGTRALIDDFARIDADTPVCGDFEWAYAILWGDPPARAEALEILEREGTARPACSLSGLPATPQFLADLTRSFESLWERGVPQNAGLAGITAWKAGRIRDARRIWDLDDQTPKWKARGDAYITALTYPDPDRNESSEVVLADDPSIRDLAWLTILAAQRGDFNAAERWLSQGRAAAETMAAEAEEDWQRILPGAYNAAAAGYVAIRRGELDSGADALADALGRMAEVGVGGWVHQVLRFEHGKALLALDRPQEAAGYFSTFNHFDAGVPVQSWLYLGHAYAAIGDGPKARHHYELFVKAWSECDPELVPLRDEALAGLEALSQVAD
jgi:tetratricopeptide (TPR) repeat protein